MKRLGKIISAIVTLGLLGGLTAVPVWASTGAISSVSIRVGTDVEAGDYLPDRPAFFNDTTEPQTGTYAAVSASKYCIDDVYWSSSSATDRELAVGDEPKLVVVLRSNYVAIGDKEYIFRGGYSSSNVSIKGGTYVSARVRDSGDILEVTVRMNGIKGAYEMPSSVEWRSSGYGTAAWSFDSDTKKLSSGYYDVSLYRGSTLVKRLEAYQGSTYNFYPYMTKEGSYSYKIRTVPGTESQKKYGIKSEWTQSDEIYIDKQHISDGRGQTDGSGVNTDQVGWIQQGSEWYYRYPDGSYQKNSWAKINNKWYLFDTNGKMVTGWQEKNGHWYYLQPAGDMLTGWAKAGEKWYYLNPSPDGPEGAMYKGWLSLGGKTYYMDSAGAMLEGWSKVGDDWYYFYPGAGYKATNTYVDGFYVDANGVWKK